VRAFDPRLLRRTRGARFGLALDVAFGLLSAVALLLQSVLFADVVAAAFDGASLADAGGEVALMIVVAAIRAFLAGAFESTGRRTGARVMSELRLGMVATRLRHAPLALDRVEAGEIATAAVQGVDALETYFARYLPQLVLAALVPVIVLIWAATVDLTSALIMLVTLPLIPIFMALIGRLTEARTRDRWGALAVLANHFLDVVRGLPTLRAYNRGEAQTQRIEEAGEAYRRTTMQVLRVSFLSGAVLETLATIATALVAVTLGVRLIDGAIELRAALIVLLLTPELYAPLRALGTQFHASADGLAAAERILDLTDAVPAIPSGRRTPPDRWEAVRLREVTLTHPGRGVPVLDRFTLEIRRGELVALVGASGAGKTTVATLLLGLRVPDAGTVSIDDVDLTEVDLAAWRRMVAWLPQRPTLFRGTIRDNIAIADPTAGTSRIEEAARLAGADRFIRELRSGYDGLIGDGGRALSAGEARRLALARALVRDAPFLCLDEPTASLDPESAELVAGSIRTIARTRTTLLIEHRAELASMADRVVRIEAGAAVDMGWERVR
jgi:ATP-binding cassette, subfamily C, bacterial CydD